MENENIVYDLNRIIDYIKRSKDYMNSLKSGSSKDESRDSIYYRMGIDVGINFMGMQEDLIKIIIQEYEKRNGQGERTIKG